MFIVLTWQLNNQHLNTNIALIIDITKCFLKKKWESRKTLPRNHETKRMNSSTIKIVLFLKKRKFVLSYSLTTIIGAVIIGAILGNVIGINKAVALFSGYAGTDLLEGLAKGFKLTPIRIG